MSNDNKLKSITEPRDKSSGLNLPKHQGKATPEGLRPELRIIPSTTVPQWGSTIDLDFREKGNYVSNFIVQMNVSQVTATVAGSANIYLAPMVDWFYKVEILIGGETIETKWTHQMFLESQLFLTDDERLKLNNAQGNYQNATQRYNKNQMTTADYFFPIKSLFDDGCIPCLTSKHDVKIRLFLNPLVSVVQTAGNATYTGLTGGTINSCNLLANVVKISSTHANALEKSISKAPHHYLFHDICYLSNPYSATQGGQTQITLTSITGRVAWLAFCIQPVSANLTQSNLNYYTTIQSFEVRDSGSANIVGGQPLTDGMDKLLMQQYTKSTYLTENALGSDLAGAVMDNGANVYSYSWSIDPFKALRTGSSSGSYFFTGQETLTINWTSSISTSTQYQISVFAFTESAYEHGVNEVKKMKLTK